MVSPLNLPPPRELPWPLKPIESAETSLSYDVSDRMVLAIKHEVLAGLTPDMVAWWFSNIAGDIEIGGRRLNRYLVWHPRDHILWELARPALDGKAGVGARFRIVEAFGRNPDFAIDVTETVTRLGETGITLVGMQAGLQVSELRHDFSSIEGGTLYVSRLTVGISTPFLRRAVNPLIRRFAFTEAMGRAWLKHNVEEVGLLEHIVPLLLRDKDRAVSLGAALGVVQEMKFPMEYSGVCWRRAAGSPASDVTVREIQQVLGVTLPAPLLALVHVADGLRPEHESIVQGDQAIDALTQILRFADGQILNCRDAMLEDAENADRDPAALRWVIPVADNGDGWICLDYRADPNRVAYRVVGYSLSRVSNADHNGLYPIADSFEAVLEMLRPRPSRV